MKRIMTILLTMALVVCAVSACGKEEIKTDPAGKDDVVSSSGSGISGSASGSGIEDLGPTDSDGNLTGKHHIKIKVKKYGTIKATLYADKAPITVTNFIKLARSGFYDGLTFHRVISSFMIQGGDPQGDGTGGSGEPIKGEFASNGVKNKLSHVRGTLSMARTPDNPNSARSQFFIMHQDATYLDGDYAAFGKVTKGIKVVDKICANTEVVDNNGTVVAGKQPVIQSITVID